MKIGIITLPFEPNYGWALQAWALYNVIKDLGHDPVIINRRWNSSVHGIIYKVKRFIYNKILCNRFLKFITKEIPNWTKEIRNTEDATLVTKSFEAIIAGSDQIWRIENTRGADYDMFLGFVKNEKQKRISYAASFGTDVWNGDEADTITVKNLLKQFDSVSVRENTGVSLCYSMFGITATHVLDPTLLFTKQDYNLLLKCPKSTNNLVSYILDYSIGKSCLLSSIASTYNLNAISLYPRGKIYFYKSVYYWLETIRDAKFVIVDSFHGMVFSIIFHKQFIVWGNSKRGLTRFTSLLSSLGLLDRMIESNDSNIIYQKLCERINYNQVDEKLNELRFSSIDFLKNALE